MCEQETNSGDQKLTGESGATDKAGTVLVVDDDSMMLTVTRALLEDADYRVLEARHGEAALEIFHTHGAEIDLIILDLVMPRMDGQECLDRLLEIDPEVKVLATSGYYIDDATYAKIEPKIAGFIPKPIDPALLVTLVGRILHKQ